VSAPTFWTNVPEWSGRVPAVDPRAAAALVLALGEAAGEAVATWGASLRDAGVPTRVARPADVDEALAVLAEELASAHVGWRLLAAAPEADLLRIRAAAHAAGVLDAEIVVHATEVAVRRVLCAHCDAVTETTAEVGGTCACAGCGRELHVYHHVSRRLAAYLGFMADAEGVDPPVLEEVSA
jgi:dimethylamine monooxygenase subunit C